MCNSTNCITSEVFPKKEMLSLKRPETVSLAHKMEKNTDWRSCILVIGLKFLCWILLFSRQEHSSRQVWTIWWQSWCVSSHPTWDASNQMTQRKQVRIPGQFTFLAVRKHHCKSEPWPWKASLRVKEEQCMFSCSLWGQE